MLKTLIRKQLLEINKGFFYDSRRGKNRSKAGTIAFIAFYVLLMAGFLGGTFGFLAYTIGSVLIPLGMGWLFFDMMGLIAIVLGIFGSVFNTFATLYQAKDNEFLLSMPVPVKYILISRLMSVYLMGLMFSGIVIVPTAIVYYIFSTKTLLSIISPILMVLNVSVFVLTLSIALGWVVAKINTKLKNKSFFTVLLSLLFIAAYYFVYFRATELLTDFLMNVDSMEIEIKGATKILYTIGASGDGKAIPMVVTTAINLAVFYLAYRLLDKTFIRIVTTKTGDKKVQYKQKDTKVMAPRDAIFRKELSRLTSSATYMLNCALGTVVMPILIVLLYFKGDMLFANFSPFLAGYSKGTLIMGAVAFTLSLNTVSAASISIEGKDIWIYQTLPVEPIQVLMGKLKLHLVLSLPFVFVLVGKLCSGLELSGLETAMTLIGSTCFVILTAELGLVLNLLRPNLNWTSETAAVKQGLPIVIVLFGGWVLGGAMIISGMLLPRYLNPMLILGIWSILTILIMVLLFSWLKTKGSRIFSEL